VTLSDFAAIGEAVSGFAVLLTLGYLAYQFRQTAAIERTAGQRDLLGQARSWVELTLVHKGLFEVLRKVLADWESGTPEEKESGNAWMLSSALQAEQALYMWREGLINEGSFRGFINVAVSVAATPGGRLWWRDARIVLGDDISDFIDRELESRSADAPDWTQVLSHWGPDESST
jgi:hypothetical protein